MTSDHRPTYEQFLSSIEHDTALLAVAARKGLGAAVPTCPGWTVRDLVLHLGRIHREKENTVEHDKKDQDFVFEPPDTNEIKWFEDGASLMLEAFRKKKASDPAWTWFKPDQTVGFWARRMAHETLIHRVDAELAHGEASDIDDLIAADGVDEALRVFIEGVPPWATPNRGERVIRLSTPDRSWMLRQCSFSGTTRSGRVFDRFPTVIYEDASDNLDCEITGPPDALDLWIWGRGPLSALSVVGDPHLAEWFRDLAAKST